MVALLITHALYAAIVLQRSYWKKTDGTGTLVTFNKQCRSYFGKVYLLSLYSNIQETLQYTECYVRTMQR